jgi:DNA polymerase-3 subunit epsilon
MEFVSLDIETTGLDAATADMLSVGWVLIREGKVDLRTAESFIVRPSGGVGNSASVHGLTDTLVGTGLDWGIVLDKIVRVLVGRVLLVHHAGLDKALLDRMCQQRFGHRLPVPVVDTLALEHRRLNRHHHLENNSSLRLYDLRDEYGLPRYAAHDCLVDAIATAELLLAIVSRRPSTSLGDLLG